MSRLGIMAYVLFAPWITLSVRYLTHHFDSLTLSSCRFIAGAPFLLLFAGWGRWGEVVALIRSPRHMPEIVGMALFTIFGVFAMVEGVAHAGASVAALFQIAGLPLLLATAAVAFQDERSLIRQPRFLCGAAFSLVGMVCIAAEAIVNNPMDGSLIGILYLGGAILAECVHSVLLKRLTQAHPPVVVGGVTGGIASVGFLVWLFGFGNPASIADAPWVATLVLFGSGVFGIALGMGLAYKVVREMGLSRSRLLGLTAPVLVILLAVPLFGEHVSLPDILGGSILLVGAWLAITTREQSQPAPASS